jgi:RNA polymerase sigma-70 factor (ECF subfamily)
VEFAALVEPCITRAYRLAYGIIHDRQAAEDAVQEALVRAYRSLENLQEGRPFWPWFFRIVVNEALKQAKRSRRPAAPLDPPGTADSPEHALLDREERQRVWKAIHRLPPAQRAVILLRYYEELSEAEMAEVLGARPGTVKSRLHYARLALERQLTAPEPPRAPWWRLTRLLSGGVPHD